MLGLKGLEFRAEQGAPTYLLGYNTPSKTRVPCLLITIKKEENITKFKHLSACS